MRSSDSKTFILDVVRKTFNLKTGNNENILIFINLLFLNISLLLKNVNIYHFDKIMTCCLLHAALH